jgi:hypothetical protein
MEIKKKTEIKDDLVTITASYKEEAKNAKANRMRLNRTNYDCYHLRQDWSHKRKGQSREFLAKQPMAVEQISTFIQQGLVDSGDWFGVQKAPGVTDAVLTESEVAAIMKWAFEKCEFLTYVGDSVKDCLLQSLAITKNYGCYKPKAYFYTETKEKGGKFVDVLKRETRDYWCPKLELVRAEDFYPDPSGKGLYVIHETYLDISELYAMSEGPYAVYDRSKVELLHGTLMESDMQAAKKSRETGQNTSINGYRKKVKINECWGTILDPATGKVRQKDVVWTIADDRIVIQEPTDYPFWHNSAPLISAAFVRVPRSVWHKALMDAPTQTNIALNELYNLMVDAGMNDAHGIKQIRADWLEDESQVSNGIYPGITLKVNSQCPPGMKVLERVDTSSMSSEALNVFNTMSAEFSASALTNDLRMGVLPNRAVKATEVVEASQSITSVFTGISKVLEQTHIEPNMNMMFANILQHFSEIDPAEMKAVLGDDRYFTIVRMGKEALFAKAYDGFKFRVYGISKILAKQKDFRKFTALLQTIASSDLLVEEFIKQFSMGRFLGKIIKSLDINEDELKIGEEDKLMMMMGQMGGGQAPMPSEQGPNMQSQIPQAGAQQSAETVESMIPRSNFGGLQGKAEGGMA